MFLRVIRAFFVHPARYEKDTQLGLTRFVTRP